MYYITAKVRGRFESDFKNYYITNFSDYSYVWGVWSIALFETEEEAQKVVNKAKDGYYLSHTENQIVDMETVRIKEFEED